MFYSLNNSQKNIFIIVAWLFGFHVGTSSGYLISVIISYAFGFIWGMLTLYLYFVNKEKIEKWVISNLFWRRGKNV